MFYTRLIVRCDPDFTEILTAELAEAGFDAFMETADGFEAFVEGANYDEEMVEDIWHRYADAQNELAFAFEKVEKRNWNEEWEKNYEPVVVNDKCLIRAEFHSPQKKFPYEIIITPRMSFGTGHHQTNLAYDQRTNDDRPYRKARYGRRVRNGHTLHYGLQVRSRIRRSI